MSFLSLIQWLFFIFFCVFFFSDLNLQGVELEPEFEGTITNVTFPAGREAVLTCSVRNLGRYKVRFYFFWMDGSLNLRFLEGSDELLNWDLGFKEKLYLI